MTTLRGVTTRYPVLPILLVAATSAVIVTVMQPWLILTANTPTGGDTGAHVLVPTLLRDTLLPEGRIIGWSNAWFAGFPVLYFYFPLPSLVIVALDVLLPYGVAFKIVTAAGLAALPPAIYFHARSMLMSRTVATVAAGAGAVFAFMESFTIYGGNIASTLAGEFSYSWSFAISLVYLGLLIKAVREDKRFVKWAALAMAIMALTHILTTLVAIFASLFILAWRKGFWRTVAVWVWAFSIAAIWAIPLLARIGLSTDMAWIPLHRWEEIFPVEVWILLPVAIVGGIWAFRKSTRAAPLIAATIVPLIYYPLPNFLTEQLPAIFGDEKWKLYNGRLLPYWYFGVAFFAAVAIGAGVQWLSRRLPEHSSKHAVTSVFVGMFSLATWWVWRQTGVFPSWAWGLIAAVGIVVLLTWAFVGYRVETRSFLVGTVMALVVLGAAAGVSFVAGWSMWNYEGYESKANWPEYSAFMQTMDTLPDGRVMWEHNNELNRYGTPMSLMLIPYWTEGSHTSMEGVFFESSLTMPFHFINQSEMSYRGSRPVSGLNYGAALDMERGIKHLQLYGIDYYVSWTPEATEVAETMAELTPVAVSGPFHVYRLPETDLVETATHLPAVYEEGSGGLLGGLFGGGESLDAEGEPMPSFNDLALDWYDDIGETHRWVVAGGPPDWPRIEDLAQRPDVPLEVPPDAVTDIVVEDHRISFTTQAVGVPHVVKVSYFPNWVADGADGPWRATPSLMVVVPTQEDVVIEFRDTWAETLGKLLTAAGFAVLVVAAARSRLSRSDPAGKRSQPDADGVAPHLPKSAG
ncbi:MAG: hypothetical protein R3258_04190 [Acidimicrobiia bacterium]|nr:hypothetical protein [Acidimicrobiia bacterium]